MGLSYRVARVGAGLPLLFGEQPRHRSLPGCKNGAGHYRKRLPGASGSVASPLAVDQHVYCLDTNGQISVIEAGPELNVVGSSELDEMCWATPAVAGDRLLLRTVDHLYCIGEKQRNQFHLNGDLFVLLHG